MIPGTYAICHLRILQEEAYHFCVKRTEWHQCQVRVKHRLLLSKGCPVDVVCEWFFQGLLGLTKSMNQIIRL